MTSVECSAKNKAKVAEIRERLAAAESGPKRKELEKLEEDYNNKKISEQQFNKAAKPLLKATLNHTKTILKELSVLVKNNPECFKDSEKAKLDKNN